MSDARVLANYLADKISKGGWLDIEELSDQIMGALIVMSPPDTKKGKELKSLHHKLHEFKGRDKSHQEKMKIERDFWKGKARDRMDDWEIEVAYTEIDEKLEKQGL